MSEIVWAAPPDLIRGRTFAGKTKRFVEALKERPGEWALYPTTVSSASTASNYKKQHPGTEWTSRTRPDGRADLYARWVGE